MQWLTRIGPSIHARPNPFLLGTTADQAGLELLERLAGGPWAPGLADRIIPILCAAPGQYVARSRVGHYGWAAENSSPALCTQN